jgi:hypothetical protein
VLGVLILLTLAAPLLVAQDWPVTRFFLGVFSVLMVFKTWELERLQTSGHVLDWSAHLRFVANVFCLSLLAARSAPRPTLAQSLRKLIIALCWMTGAVVLMTLLHRLPAGSTPFWFQHLIVATALITFVTFELELYVVVTRLFGGAIIEANNRPWLAVTPADFWRRYNRIIGQFLHDNVFHALNSKHHSGRALMAVFAVSGLLHEYVFWLAVERAAGLQMVFFMLQGTAVVLTARVKPRREAAVWWRLATWGFMLLTSLIFFISFDLMFPVYPEGLLPGWVIW